MKKTLMLLLALTLCLTAALTVSADDYDYEYYLVNDLEMVVPMPVRYDVFTREMAEDDPLFDKYGTDLETIMNILENSNIYLDGVTAEREITFSCSVSDYDDLYGMEDEEINKISEEFKDQLESAGANDVSSEIYTAFTDTFIVFSLTDAAGCSTYSFITVKDGLDMAFSVKALDGTEISSEDQEIIEFVATQSYSTASDHVPEGFDFIENKTGLSFTVPKGWYSYTAAEYEEEFDEEPYFDLMLYKYPTGSSMIYFTVTDIWEQADQSVRSEYGSRGRMSDDDLDKELVGEAIYVDPGKLESVRYNGVNYLFSKNAYDSTDDESVSNVLCTIRNGYLYTFEHSGNVAPDEDILRELAMSAVYPAFEVETEPATSHVTERETEKETPETKPEKTSDKTSSTGKTKSDKKKGSDNTLYVIISASVAALAILAIILILIFKKRSLKKAEKAALPPQDPQPQGQFYPQQGGAATQQNFVPPYAGEFPQQPTYQQPSEPQQQAYQQPAEPQAPAAQVCPGCGNPIPPTGKFCPVCGNKIRD